MKYKFIASDFDGTLLNSNNTISKRNVEAINEYIKAGGIFAVSTGRTYEAVFKRLPELNYPQNFNVPVISFQGSLITDFQSKKHMRKILMDNEILIKVTRYAKKHNIYCHIYSVDNVFVDKKCEISDYYCSYNRILDSVKYVGDLAEFIKRENPEIIKAIYIGDEDEITEILNRVNHDLKGEVLFTRSFSRFIECVSPLSGKGNAVLFAANELGIKNEEIICIGDSMNDLSMIQSAALGVAVQNADPELKKCAGLVTPVTNDGDAVAWLIEKALNNTL